MEYRAVKGFPGYRVGTDGSVWSCWVRNGWNNKPRIISSQWHRLLPVPDSNKPPYYRVSLHCDGRQTARRVHLLVLEAFVGLRPAGMQACHNNGNKADCSLANLRWDTPTANQRDRRKHGTACLAGNNYCSLDLATVRAIEIALQGDESQRSIARQHGVSQTAVSRIKRGLHWGSTQGTGTPGGAP